MLDILEIKAHATKTADEGLPVTACPYDETSAHGLLWLDHYWSRVYWLSGEMSA